MKRVEFLEFIGRFSELLYAQVKQPLVRKIEMFLRPLLKAVVNKTMNLPENDDGVESESDYEDDLVDEIIAE